MADPFYCSPPFTNFVCLPLAWEGVWGAVTGLVNALVVVGVAAHSVWQIQEGKKEHRAELQRIEAERLKEREQSRLSLMHAALIELTGFHTTARTSQRVEANIQPPSALRLLSPYYEGDTKFIEVIGKALQAWSYKQAEPQHIRSVVEPIGAAIAFLVERLERAGIPIDDAAKRIAEAYRKNVTVG